MQVMNFNLSKCMTFHISVHYANITQAWIRVNGECWFHLNGLVCAWHKQAHWIRLISLLLEPNPNVNNEEWSHQWLNNISCWCSLWFAWYIRKATTSHCCVTVNKFSNITIATDFQDCFSHTYLPGGNDGQTKANTNEIWYSTLTRCAFWAENEEDECKE